MAKPEAGERRGLRVWPIWVIVGILLALGFWLFSSRRSIQTGAAHDIGPVPTADEVRSKTGQRVEFTVRVDEVAPSRAFWVALQQGKRLLVLPVERDTPMDAVRHGEMLSIAGRLEKPASQDVIVREWNLDPRTANILAREPLYLRAERIRPAAAK